MYVITTRYHGIRYRLAYNAPDSNLHRPRQSIALMAGKKKATGKPGTQQIAVNKKARHDYFIEERLEAGVVLQGWEVKSLRAGRLQLTESYVILRDGEAWLLGAHITPLTSASTHIKPDVTRTRKLLLHKKELGQLIGAVERRGYTLVALAMYWKKGMAKIEIGLAKGKAKHDKRATERDRDWDRQKQRLLKTSSQ